MEDLKTRIAALAANLGIATLKDKEERFSDWLTRASSGKSQAEVLKLINMYNARRELVFSFKKTIGELKKKKKVKKPTTLIIKGYTFFEISDCSVKPCGVPRFDNKYKDFFIGYGHPTKPPALCYTKVLPTIISEVQIFNDAAHVIGYIKHLLNEGIEKARIRRLMKYFLIGKEALSAKMASLKDKFCIKDGTGIRGLVIYPAKQYRIPTSTAVAGVGGYARMVRS